MAEREDDPNVAELKAAENQEKLLLDAKEQKREKRLKITIEMISC